jgi:hypothetical protein
MRIIIAELIVLSAALVVACGGGAKSDGRQDLPAAVQPCEASQSFIDTINSLKVGETVDEAQKVLSTYPRTTSLVGSKKGIDPTPKFRELMVYPSAACWRESSKQKFVELYFRDSVHLSGLYSNNIAGVKWPDRGGSERDDHARSHEH